VAKSYHKFQQCWKLTRTKAAKLLGLSCHILKQWEQATSQPATATAAKSSLQGKNRSLTDRQIDFITKLWKDYGKERNKIKMTAFMKYVRKNWQQQSWLTPVPSRKSVEDLLLANGCRKPKTQAKPRPNYHPAVKRYFPHAQIVLDGKQVIVSLNGHDYSFVLEFCKDMASDATGGYAIAETETAALVKQAVSDYCAKHPRPLAALIDNGSGNVSAAVDLGAEGILMIRAYPYRAETKGQIEGEFSLFEQKVSQIVIQGSTEKELAMNILKQVVELYLKLRNHTPRCSVCPFTPAKLMAAKLDGVDAEAAYHALKAQQQKRQQQTEQRLKMSAEYNDLVDSIVKEHQLEGDLLRLKKTMKWIELSTIRKAEAQFSVLSHRDNFDPSKRTMAYFCAMARNFQQKKDQQQWEQTARSRYALDQNAKQQRAKIASQLALKKEQQMLEQQPHLAILAAIQCELNLPELFRTTVTIFKKQIDEAIISILNKKTKSRQHSFLNKTYQGIMNLVGQSLETKYELIHKIKERVNELIQHQAKVVTPS
jgi:hypothetical protein